MVVQRYKFLTTLSTIIIYVFWLIVYTSLKGSYVSTGVLILVSWLGVIQTVIYIYIWWKLTKKIFSLFTIFLLFFLVFNFGQCVLWMFDISFSGSFIESTKIYKSVIINSMQILKAQLIFIVCLATLNLGAILVYRRRPNNAILAYNQKLNYKKITPGSNIENVNNNNEEWKYEVLYKSSLILSIAVVPVSLYAEVISLISRMDYGYSDLYYGVSADRLGPIINILCTCFLPCLLGLLIGSHYKNRVRVIVYGIFAIYAILSLLCGDRGEWILKLVILYYADYHFYRKKSVRSIILFLIVGYLFLFLMDAIVAVRNQELTLAGIINGLFLGDSPIVSMLAEYGSSMGINITLIGGNVVFPYGNSFLMSILTAPSTSLAGFFGIDYVQLSTWFSSSYLGISYGADFTIIGECILNFGEYFAPVCMFVIGIIVSKVAQITERQNSPLGMCVSLAIMCVIFKWVRTTFWYVLNQCFYIIVLCCVVYAIVMLFSHKTIRVSSKADSNETARQ